MSRSGLKHRWLALCLGLAVLLSQAVMALHQADQDAHVLDDPCEICLILSHLGHGIIPTVAPLTATEAPLPELSQPVWLIPQPAPFRQRARAPPASSPA